MTLLLVLFIATLVVALAANIAAVYEGKFQFRIETDIALADLDALVRSQMSGATPFQKTEGTLEHGYQRVLKRGIGPYRSEARIIVDVLPVSDSNHVVVTGWVDDYYFGRQLLIFADPFGGPAPIWAARKLRKVLAALRTEAELRHASFDAEVDHEHALPERSEMPVVKGSSTLGDSPSGQRKL